MPPEFSAGDTAWVLASAALVLLMTPALALFYGGMVRAKSVLNMMMMSFGALGLVTVLWVLYGYSMAFGDDLGGGLVGDPTQFLGLGGLMAADSLVFAVPSLAFVGFQGVFAVITVALISGAIADRAKFSAWMVFVGIWATDRLLPGRPLGLRLRRRDRRRRTASVAGSPTPSARWTSPEAPPSTSTPARPGSPWHSCSGGGSDSARSRCAPTT